MNAIAEGLFATLFPSDCRLCGTPLVNISRLPVCEDCLSAMRPISGGVCYVCGERLVSGHAFSNGEAEAKCGLCQRESPAFARALAYGSYEGGLRELIHLLKYEQVRSASNVLGRMLGEVIATLEPSFGPSVMVVPVPLHVRKMRQRGFNQSELITRAALKAWQPTKSLAIMPHVIQRERETVSQIGLTRNQRRENIRGAFTVAVPEEVAGQEILLVDDVLTTGTTVSECARILRRAGAARVWVATVARTLKHDNAFADVESETEAGIALAAHG
ncbi:MAG TPA: ComF family protein [Terriglobales bacterium]